MQPCLWGWTEPTSSLIYEKFYWVPPLIVVNMAAPCFDETIFQFPPEIPHFIMPPSVFNRLSENLTQSPTCNFAGEVGWNLTNCCVLDCTQFWTIDVKNLVHDYNFHQIKSQPLPKYFPASTNPNYVSTEDPWPKAYIRCLRFPTTIFSQTNLVNDVMWIFLHVECVCFLTSNQTFG